MADIEEGSLDKLVSDSDGIEHPMPCRKNENWEHSGVKDHGNWEI